MIVSLTSLRKDYHRQFDYSYIVVSLGLAIKPMEGKKGIKFQSVRFHLSQRQVVSIKVGQMLNGPIRKEEKCI